MNAKEDIIEAANALARVAAKYENIFKGYDAGGLIDDALLEIQAHIETLDDSTGDSFADWKHDNAGER